MSRRPPNDEAYDLGYSNASQPNQCSAPYGAYPFMPAAPAQMDLKANSYPRSGVIEPLSSQQLQAMQQCMQPAFQPAFQSAFQQQPGFQSAFQQPGVQHQGFQHQGFQQPAFQQPYSPYLPGSLPKAQSLAASAYTPAITFATAKGPVSLTKQDFIDLRDGIQVDCGDGVHIQKSGNGIKKIHKSKRVMNTELEAKRLLKEASEKDIDDMVNSNLKDMNLGKRLHHHTKAAAPVKASTPAPAPVKASTPAPAPMKAASSIKSSEISRQIADLQKSVQQINSRSSCKAASSKRISGLARDNRVNIVSVA